MRMRRWSGWIALIALGALGVGWVAAPAGATIDPESLTVSDEKLQGGVPLGGIGAGKVDLLTDGTFGNLTANNNWARPLNEMPGSFFALRTSRGSGLLRRSDARVLALHSPYGFPEVNSLRYQGRFPEAHVRYSHPAVPLAVSLRAGGALIPQNAKDSSLPQATFSFSLSNPGESAVDATLAFSWQNVVGCGGSSKSAWSDRTGNTQALRLEEGRMTLVFQNPTAPAGERAASHGQYALTAAADDGKVSFLPFWNAGSDGRDFWSSFTAAEPFTSKPAVQAGREGTVHPAGALAASVRIPAGGTTRIHFVLAWHMPRALMADGSDAGHGYANQFPDAAAVAAYALRYRETLQSGTAQWQDLLLKSSLPSWLTARLLAGAGPLVANSLITRANQFYLLDGIGDPAGRIGSLDQWLLTNTLPALLFPALERDSLRQAAGLQAASGEFPRAMGSLDRGLTPEVIAAGAPRRPDAACQFILAAYRHYRWTGDADGMRIAYPAVTRALAWLAAQDSDGDGLPEGASVWEQKNPKGTFSYTTGLYLAALRAGEALARVNLDKKSEELYRQQFTAARSSAVAQLWNGRLFNVHQDPSTGERSVNLFAGALAGEWAASLLELPEAYDRRQANSALRHLLEQLGPAGLHVPPNEVRPDGTPEPGLSDVSWSGALGTYLAALGISRGHPDAGLALARRLHEAEALQAKSPFDASIGCDPRTGAARGSRSHVSALASWNLYCAMTGIDLDEPSGILGVSPSLPGSVYGLHAPLFAPRYWSWLDFARSPHNAAVNLRLKLVKKMDDAPVMLNGLATQLPLTSDPGELAVIVTGPTGPIEGKIDTTSSRLVYLFKLPFEWRPGETVEMTVVPPDANNLILEFSPNRVWNYGSTVTATALQRERDVKFTLVNPTKERQLVNVRFRDTSVRNYEVYQSGVKLPFRFTPDTPAERLSVLVPASPIGIERLDRIRELHDRLQATREAATRDGRLPAMQVLLDPLQQKLAAAMKADETARSAQMVLAPVGNRLVRTKVRSQPPIIPSADPEPAVVAAEEAMASAPARAATEIQEERARAQFLSAYFPLNIQVDSPGSLQPGGRGRIRVNLRNNGREPIRVAVGFTFPADWNGPDEPTAAIIAPASTETLQVAAELPRSLPNVRFPVTGRAVITTGAIAWTVPLQTTLNRAYIKSWSLMGLWPATEKSLDETHPPDTDLDPARVYDGRRWRVVTGLTDRFDLAAGFTGITGSMGYAVSQVFSPREMEAILEVNCDGRYLVRVNNAGVLDRRDGNRAAVDRVNIRLRQGWNILMLKTERPQGASWGFQAEILAADGTTPEGLRYRPELVP